MNILARKFTPFHPVLEMKKKVGMYPEHVLIEMGIVKPVGTDLLLDWDKLYKDAGPNRSYVDVIISEEFLNFQKFAEWCLSQPGHNIPGWHLDKDLLSKPNDRKYSPETCCFLPAEINIGLRNWVRNANRIRQLAEVHKSELSPVAYEALLKIDSKL